MKLLIFLTVVALARARLIEDCSGIIVHNIKHDQEVLRNGIDSPYQLVIDYGTDTLFFSYTSTPDEEDRFKSANINLKTKEFEIISGITGGFANAVDQKSGTVYLGGNDGIYTYNYNTKEAVFAGARGKNIWQMFYKDQLYFTDYPEEQAYTFGYGQVTKVPELNGTKVTLMLIDKQDNIVFANSSGLYVHRKEKAKIEFIGEYVLNSLTTDINGNVYFSTPSGIYSLDEKSEKVTTLSLLISPYGLAIEANNNIIYADSNSIIRLKPTKIKCFNSDTKE